MKGSEGFAQAAIAACREADNTPGSGHYPYDGVMACASCIAQAIEDARRAESEAIADFVALRGSESGYTHVEDLVAAIRSRGAADPTSGEPAGDPGARDSHKKP